MKRLNVFCEGPTEQGFCRQVLQPHLFPNGDGIVLTLAVGSKDHHHVYGIGRKRFEKVRKFILKTIKQRSAPRTYFTTMFDLYALSDDFPGKDANTRNAANPEPFVNALENAFVEDIGCENFLPYLQLHEYETLLFSEPDAFAIAFENCGRAVSKLNEIAASFPTVEHINDGRESAPSKRIISAIPEYGGRKTSAGPDIAEYIGIQIIRSKCPHFHAWLVALENLPWT